MALDTDELEQVSEGEDQPKRRAVLIALVLIIVLLWWLLSQFGRVPDVVGLTPEDARATIEQSGFAQGAISEDAQAEPTGLVAGQSVSPGRWVLKGGEIDILVSSASEEQEAVSDAPSGETPDYVFSTPAPDSTWGEQPKNTTMGSDYVPSTSNAGPQVPGVQGLSESSAAAVLEAAGYRVEISYRTSNTSVPAGDVFYQDPPPDAYEPLGTLVKIDVSSGPPSKY